MTVAVIIAVIALVVVARSVKVVPANTVHVVERLGRFHRALTAGAHVLLPFTDRVAARYSLLPRDEELSDTCITLDNVVVNVTSTFRWQIVNAEQAAYGTADISQFIAGVVQSAQRQWISGRTWNDARETTRELNDAVLTSAEKAVTQNGVQITAFKVLRLEPAPAL